MTASIRPTRRTVLAGASAAVASPFIWTSAQAQAGKAIKIGMPLALTGPPPEREKLAPKLAPN